MTITFVSVVLLMTAAVVGAESRLACNLKALAPAERARHASLSRKLSAAVVEKRELADGLVFQIALAAVTLPELGEWIAAERKCCPFLDFHVSLERESSSVELSLTGRAGVKEFLVMDFANVGLRK
jgi:hypothetical protein